MEKQEKVLTKIKNSLKHGNEGQLGTKKNDECYTDMQDILSGIGFSVMRVFKNFFNAFRRENLLRLGNFLCVFFFKL